MNVLDLFSGIGGFSLGLERAGMRTIAFCERDEYCRAVLRKHWPSVPCFDDIHTLDADRLDRLGRIDLVCGGFPCQPFSVAGEQKGKADDRHLWPEMCRVIALARPAWVIGENVTGLISMALDDVLADLEGLGYTARTFVIPAAAVSAPHRRDRLWIVARNANRNSEPTGTIHAEEVAKLCSNDDAADAEAMQRGTLKRDEPHGALRSAETVADADRIAGARRADVCDADGEGLEVGSSQRGNSRQEFAPSVGTDWWSTEPDVGRVAHGVSRRVDRLRCLGNAVVPQVVEEIGRAILNVSNS
jgi:DNA (cytosine-5)-methyltransferase 1